MPLVDTLSEDARWDALGLPDLAESAARATLDHLGLPPETCEIALLACDDARIADLNAEFRDKPGPTNVLSWPAEELAPDADGGAPIQPTPPLPGMALELGDIAIAYDTCAREAAEQAKPLADHVTHLVVHGCLHLLGYDHIRPKDAARMEGLEVEILAKLGLPDPYGEHGA
ncbi:rRNA maturation RNase YbeY [Rhodovulum adriaticum]|uniref:Endoribonuclease YbeY n=1 Tax=Rhodovulum adriaticum TaxID=35804 RepID=A0A4R2NI00_RHOAD|nr:rRNA maturation RNase YbeY [Rhodovulum adriaticum]MBK1637127.1 rRNA maturation RNase YbeY [Rhodovulum adriaticum]TCP20898.1 putative rRNA maturation factor [Rhodovulum adriaticum]